MNHQGTKSPFSIIYLVATCSICASTFGCKGLKRARATHCRATRSIFAHMLKQNRVAVAERLLDTPETGTNFSNKPWQTISKMLRVLLHQCRTNKENTGIWNPVRNEAGRSLYSYITEQPSTVT